MITAGFGSPLNGGEAAAIRFTPATRAVTMLIWAEGNHGVFATGHVAADAADGDVPVAEHHAGQGLDLDIAERSTLYLGKVPHLGLGEGDVRDVLPAHSGEAGFDLGLAQAKIRAFPAIEPFRHRGNCCIAGGLDLGERGLDDRPDLLVRLCLLAFRQPGFQIDRHRALLPCFVVALAWF